MKRSKLSKTDIAWINGFFVGAESQKEQDRMYFELLKETVEKLLCEITELTKQKGKYGEI